MAFFIVRQDITTMEVDAIVNAANIRLQRGGGVCGAIFEAAGAATLQEACEKLSPIQVGEAVVTPGFKLSAKFIIHAAGPVYRPEKKKESARLLRTSYLNALKCAVENHCESVAFPLISSGIYGYPKEEALEIATVAMKDFLAEHELDVTLVVFDSAAFAISQEQWDAVQNYLDEYYVEAPGDLRRFEEEAWTYESERKRADDETEIVKSLQIPVPKGGLDNLLENLDEPFADLLFRLIDIKGKGDVEVYKKANLDRKLFSKIRTNREYVPSKKTVLALAIGLELSLDETEAFLARAGYALSHAVLFDVMMEYFIQQGQYDVFAINQMLFAYDQPLLGW